MNLNSNIRRNLTSNRSTDRDGRSQKPQCLSARAFIPGSTWEFSTECLSNVLSSDGSPGSWHKTDAHHTQTVMQPPLAPYKELSQPPWGHGES